jgi:subtilisin family serine protease
MLIPSKIGISFKNNLALDSLKKAMDKKAVKAKQRPEIVIRALQKVAAQSQHTLTDWLQTEKEYRGVKNLWIVNRIIAKVAIADVLDVAQFEEVELIDLETGRFEMIEDPRPAALSEKRSEGVAEPGLLAINARGMWELGYTGRGRLLYDFDTGVWADHPAFAKRFIGKRFPEKQAWLGYFRDFPNGIISSHGTHTLGTMAGLVEESKDTLGAAFGAYWIANDLVVSSVEALPPIEELAFAFEWALNPDGDVNTTYDIPDVINNSWRFSDEPTTDYCEGWVVDLMNAIEAAGIANVFSGGNAGPDNTTVSAPQRINTSVVNTFSVGSVDANQNAPYPISSFSTHGPTQCPGEGSEKIHPQVVAPGSNVRSAWGTNSYNSISGTSMSAPHVSGAVLLLKEAFPDLTGETLLWALYETAIDYGVEGEDNIFGKGLIDVRAAFDYLAEQYTPSDPNMVSYDFSIDLSAETEALRFICSDFIQPELKITNLGQNTPDSILISYWFSEGTDTSTLQVPGTSAQIELSPLALDDFGEYEIYFALSYPDKEVFDYDVYNNRCKYTFTRTTPKNLPFSEDFETGIDERIWFVDNPDLDYGWDTFPVSGLENSQYAATLQFYKYTPRAGQKDGLILNNLTLPVSEVILTYDLAYQPFFGSSTINDTFQIFVWEACDERNRDLLYQAAGDDLYVSDSIFINFKPEFPGHWRRDTLSLSDYAGKEVSILFQGINQKWNNLYLDNISIKELLIDQTRDEKGRMASFLAYPNPAGEWLYLRCDDPEMIFSPIQLTISDVHGFILHEEKLKVKDVNKIRIKHLQPGMYWGTVRRSDRVEGFKFLKF